MHEHPVQVSLLNIFRVKTVVEIGCGSGDMTKVLTEAIPNYSRFLSLDIDPVMVQHASQVNSGKGVEFVVQDFNVPFDNMDPKLQQLENEVDLIWSNYVLHFMKPKNRVQALQAVRRLLKDNGMVYVNIPLTGNLLNYWSPERRVALGMLLKIPNNDDQEASWKREFVQAGLHINFTKIRHRETTLIRSKLKPYTNLISSAASVHLTEEEKTEETLTLLKDLSDVSTQDLDDKVYMHEVILSLVATK